MTEEELEQLLVLLEPLDFPPAFMNFIYEVYTGPRLLQAEQVTSHAVHCGRGMLAGCPAAPLVAKHRSWDHLRHGIPKLL